MQRRAEGLPALRPIVPVDPRPPAPRPGDALLGPAMAPPTRPWPWVVRLFDLAVVALALIPGLVLVGVAAVVILLADGRPVFFAQDRLGRDGRPFRLVKLRTMALDADARLVSLLRTSTEARNEFLTARKLKQDPRLIGPGPLMRRLKVDELPQLWNVVRGEMSIVGPRPVVPDEIARYGPFGQLVFALRPGLTGPWQVSGTEAEDYRARVELDLAFVQSHTMRDILRLAISTPTAVARSARVPEFA